MTVTGSSLRRSTRRFAARLSPPLANIVFRGMFRGTPFRTEFVSIKMFKSLKMSYNYLEFFFHLYMNYYLEKETSLTGYGLTDPLKLFSALYTTSSYLFTT